MEDEVFKLNTSGYLLVQCYSVIVGCVALDIILVLSIFRTGLQLSLILLISVSLYCAAFFSKIASIQRIELSADELISYSSFTRKSRFFPKAIKQKIRLLDVQHVAFGRLKDLSPFAKARGTPFAVILNRGLLLPVPLRYALGFSPVMVVTGIDEADTLVVSIKPFADAAIKRLIQELKDRRLHVIIDPSLRRLA